ncbi:MAG: DUF4136 domain-containing protein [Terriglobia bacterium]
MKPLRILWTALFILLLPILALGQKVTVDFEKEVNFSKFKTYSWGRGTPVPNPMMDQRVVAGIEAQLAAKGLQKVADNADLEVFYHAAVGKQTQLNTTNMGGWGYGWGRYGAGMGTAVTTVQNIPTGELIVDVGDIQAKKFIWRGTARDTLSDKPEKNQKKLEKALTKMFQKFPPPPGKK